MLSQSQILQMKCEASIFFFYFLYDHCCEKGRRGRKKNWNVKNMKMKCYSVCFVTEREVIKKKKIAI